MKFASLLKSVISKLDESEREVVICFDEMAITQRIDFNPTLKTFTGFISKEVSKDEYFESDNPQDYIADKVLVFMIKFVSCNYKQPIAYYYTNKHLDNQKMADVILDLIFNFETDSGIGVHGILCDQAGQNRGIFNILRKIQTVNSSIKFLQHPVQTCDNRPLFLMYDNPHNLKNLRNGLLSNTVFKLPDWFCKKNSVSDEVSFKVFEEVKKIQSSSELSNIYKLTNDMLNPKPFEKMRVS